MRKGVLVEPPGTSARGTVSRAPEARSRACLRRPPDSARLSGRRASGAGSDTRKCLPRRPRPRGLQQLSEGASPVFLRGKNTSRKARPSASHSSARRPIGPSLPRSEDCATLITTPARLDRRAPPCHFHAMPVNLVNHNSLSYADRLFLAGSSACSRSASERACASYVTRTTPSSVPTLPAGSRPERRRPPPPGARRPHAGRGILQLARLARRSEVTPPPAAGDETPHAPHPSESPSSIPTAATRSWPRPRSPLGLPCRR